MDRINVSEFLLIFLLAIFLLPSADAIPSDWWGNVTIINASGSTNTSTNGAVIAALANNATLNYSIQVGDNYDIVGTPDSGYYLVHVDCSSGQKVKFQVYGVNASPTNLTAQNCPVGGGPGIELNLLAHLVASGSTCPASYPGQPTGNIHNGCSAGFCVHNICRAAATNCGDGFCDAAESCSSDDSACSSGQACTNGCVATSSSGTTSTGGGGGGGGGAAPPTQPPTTPPEEPPAPPTYTQTFPSLGAGEEVSVAVTTTGIPLQGILFTASTPVQDSQLTVQSLSTKPTTLPNPPGTVLSYLSISAPKLTGNIQGSVTLTFHIPLSWIADNSLNKDTVSLYRYTTAWNKLPTTKVSEDASFVRYQATSPGFSTFAISGEQAAPSSLFACGDGVCNGDETCSTCSGDCGSCPPLPPLPVKPPIGQSELIFIIVVVIVILIAVFLYRRKNRQPAGRARK